MKEPTHENIWRLKSLLLFVIPLWSLHRSRQLLIPLKQHSTEERTYYYLGMVCETTDSTQFRTLLLFTMETSTGNRCSSNGDYIAAYQTQRTHLLLLNVQRYCLR